jgi:hypothetical protein
VADHSLSETDATGPGLDLSEERESRSSLASNCPDTQCICVASAAIFYGNQRGERPKKELSFIARDLFEKKTSNGLTLHLLARYLDLLSNASFFAFHVFSPFFGYLDAARGETVCCVERLEARNYGDLRMR